MSAYIILLVVPRMFNLLLLLFLFVSLPALQKAVIIKGQCHKIVDPWFLKIEQLRLVQLYVLKKDFVF